MKKNLRILLVLLLWYGPQLATGQFLDNHLHQYEITPEQRDIPTRSANGVVKRQSDQAILRLTGIQHRASGGSPIEIAQNYLSQNMRSFGLSNTLKSDMHPQKPQTLNGGTVVRFRQHYQGFRVDRNEIVVKLNQLQEIRSVINTTFPIQKDLSLKPQITQQEAISQITKHLRLKASPSLETAELMIHLIGGEPFLSWQVNIIPGVPNADWECFVDAQTGKILEVKNLACSVNGTGNVFNPTPTYSAGVPYATGNFVDNSDATNTDLDGELTNVTLLDIEDLGGTYRLNGPFASIVDPTNTYDQSSTNFTFTRDQDGFEAAMCYYYLDKSMRYINNDLGVALAPAEYTGGVRYQPHINVTNAYFYPSSGQVAFGDGSNHVDSGEDALIILHELGHAIHHWSTGENHSTNEGLSEGISDYWGMSDTRPCGATDTYQEWEPEWYQVFHWGLMPTVGQTGIQRTTNFTGNYCSNIGGQPSTHASGQWISTALMRIYQDLGKEKTDQAVMEAMPMWSGSTNLQEAGADLYQAAIDLNYSQNDLCRIYAHLDDVLCISQPPASVAAPTGGTGDVYIKDTPCDNGQEVNPDNGPMWTSEDIWIRHTNDNGLEHQNPEYKTNSPNYVYVRVRGIGCNALTDGTLRLYFSKANTGLTWPTTWDNYFVNGPNGSVLAGDEITATPVTIPSLAAGEETILEIPWYPPDPDDFFTEKHHFCLLARVISSTDPMHIAEGPSVNANTRNNNNIAWKNVSVFDNDPNNLIQGPISVYMGCDPDFHEGMLQVQAAPNTRGLPIEKLGNVMIELVDPLRTTWIRAGMRGQEFEMDRQGRLIVLNEKFQIRGVNIRECNEYVNIYFEPFDEGRQVAFDVIQTDREGIAVGGERFVYRPGKARFRNQGTADVDPSQRIQSKAMSAFPNPTNRLLTVETLATNTQVASFEIFDIQGRQVLQVNTDQGAIGGRHHLDVKELAKGLYLLVAKDQQGKRIDDLKFVKE